MPVFVQLITHQENSDSLFLTMRVLFKRRNYTLVQWEFSQAIPYLLMWRYESRPVFGQMPAA